MAVVVEHDKRKKEILEKSLDLFIEEGYEDVTYQKIADRCGITRTTLYIYFKNKKEIFLWSIKQLTAKLEEHLVNIIGQKESAPETLRLMFNRIIDECESNNQLFKVLLVYLQQQQKVGVDPNERVARRVIKLQHMTSIVVIRGQKEGTIKAGLPVKDINDQFYSLMETAIFRMSVLGKEKLDDIRSMVDFSISQIRVE